MARRERRSHATIRTEGRILSAAISGPSFSVTHRLEATVCGTPAIDRVSIYRQKRLSLRLGARVVARRSSRVVGKVTRLRSHAEDKSCRSR